MTRSPARVFRGSALGLCCPRAASVRAAPYLRAAAAAQQRRCGHAPAGDGTAELTLPEALRAAGRIAHRRAKELTASFSASVQAFDLRAASDRGVQVAFQSALTFLVTAVLTVVCFGGLFFVFRDAIRSNTSESTAEVTSRVINNPTVIKDLSDLTRGVVRTVLRDEESVNELVSTLQRLVTRPESKEYLSELTVRTFKDPQTIDGAKKFVVEIFNDDWMQDKVTVFGHKVTREVLRDGELRGQARAWAADVLKSAVKHPDVQAEAGVALRAAALHALGIRSAGRVKTQDEEMRELRQSHKELQEKYRETRQQYLQLQSQILDRIGAGAIF